MAFIGLSGGLLTIVKGIGENIYEVLYHYYKHDKKEVKNTLDWIRKEFYLKVQEVENIKSLMTLEGDTHIKA